MPNMSMGSLLLYIGNSKSRNLDVHQEQIGFWETNDYWGSTRSTMAVGSDPRELVDTLQFALMKNWKW